MLSRYSRADSVLLVCLLVIRAGASGPVAAQADAREMRGAAGPAPERLEEAERFVARNWSRLGLPGVAVGVGTADSVVLAVAYGSGTFEGGTLTSRTPFHIGSVTKTFTAAAAARMARRGLVDLDAPVESYLKGFTMRAPFTPGSMTLRHLLQHTSGLGQWIGHDRRAQREGRFDHLAPSRPPGERGEYSSLNFMIVGRVLSEASGRPYGRLLDEILFRPLDMQSGFVDGWGVRPSGIAQGHQSWFGLQRRRAEPEPPPYLVPAGFAGASAYDLARYGGMLVGGGSFAGRSVLDEATVADLLGPLDSAGRALSWGRSREGGRLVLEHSGNARTSSARVRLVPEEGYAIAVLANTNSGPFFDATSAILEGVDAILAGRPAPDPWPAERVFRGAVLVGTLASVLGMARKVRAWGRAGHPVGLDPSAGALGRLALDVGLGAAVLIGVPRLAGVPLSTMIEYFPDLGVGLAVSASAGIVGGAFAAFTRSATR